MLYIYLILIISINIIASLYIIRKYRFYKTLKINIYSERALNNYLNYVLKKRNSNSKIDKKAIKYKYKSIILPKMNIDLTNIELSKKNKNIFWCENTILKFKDELYNINHVVNNYKPTLKYRLYNGKIIINEIAKTYAFLSLTRTSFDMVKHFKSVTSNYKLFKKEIQILPFLIKYYYVAKLNENLNLLSNIRTKILNFKSNNNKNAKNINNEFVYASYMYNIPCDKLCGKSVGELNKSIYDLSSLILDLSDENNKIISKLLFL